MEVIASPSTAIIGDVQTSEYLPIIPEQESGSEAVPVVRNLDVIHPELGSCFLRKIRSKSTSDLNKVPSVLSSILWTILSPKSIRPIRGITDQDSPSEESSQVSEDPLSGEVPTEEAVIDRRFTASPHLHNVVRRST